MPRLRRVSYMERIANTITNWIKIIIPISLFLFVLSCNSNIERDYYSTGELYSEFHQINGVKNGVETIFYKSGQIREEHHYLNGIKNGTSTHFYQSGNLLKKSFYNNGYLEGREIVYFDENIANIKRALRYDMDKIVGRGYYYYLNGKVSKYIHYNDLGNPIYEVNYDEYGRILEARGTPFISVSSITSQVYEKNKEYRVLIKLASPPEYRPIIQYGEIDSSSLEFKSKYMRYNMLESDSGFIYTFSLDSPQTHHWKIEYEHNYVDSLPRQTRILIVKTEII